MGRIFRNEGMDTRHNPEFTTIEFYEAYTNIEGMMERTEGVIKYVNKIVNGKDVIPFGDLQIDLGKPFAKITMTEAVRKYAGVDFDQIETREQAVEVAKAHGIEVEPKHERGDILSLFFEEYAEKNQPNMIITKRLSSKEKKKYLLDSFRKG